ncbi:protein-L-isoaspartate(D-aspartate) O-methyltransferase [Candidatus Poribacteria bacterium]|nr:protein-L-isoaspartate(D-aspartate) O-methyltransferase [Candidatus Poribacteria bacterium]
MRKAITSILVLLSLIVSSSLFAIDDEVHRLRRAQMVDVLKREGIKDKNVLEAMGEVPRHEFVPKNLTRYAYENRPLPIGYGQTISQPYIVALMTELLKVNKDSVVLEVGTGSGYQAAVLSKLVKKVYTIEIIKELGEPAKKRLRKLGYKNVEVKIGDGYYGWKEHAPFDAIIVTCAARHVPPPLIKQLKPGGRMCIPVGSFLYQNLILIEKTKEGKLKQRNIIPVMFVPLLGPNRKPR